MSGEELSPEAEESSPGQVLARAREALGVTQREVSDALNLPITTIAAIENDDKSGLPAHVFARGYVRAYAKLLEVDPEPLVAALVQDHASTESANPQDSEGRGQVTGARFVVSPSENALRNPRNIAIAVVSALVLAGIVWAVMPRDGESIEASIPPVAEQAEETMVESRPEPAEEAQEVPVPAAPSPQAGPMSEGTTLRRLTDTGDDRLSLQFVEECWVEIKDAQNNVLFGDLGQIGQRMEFVGAGPFRVLLGYAPGVVLEYNAEPIALAPHTRNNVASLVLGQ